MRGKKHGFLGGTAIGIILAVLLVGGFFWCSETIPAGSVGVVYNLNGGIEEDVLQQGWKWVSPTKKITLYSVALEQSYMTADSQGDSKNDESFEIPTKEGAALDVDVAFSYSFDRDRVPETFTRFRGQDGKEILQTFIKPKMQAWIKEITPEFTLMQIVATQRGAVNNTITTRLAERFKAYGIIIDNIALADIRPDTKTSDAINQKIQAQEELERAKVNAETEKVNAQKEKDVATISAEKDKEVAIIKAEQKKITAQGNADAKLIQAEAEAEANRKIAASLTPELVDLQKSLALFEKWNGENIHTLVGGESNALPIVNITE